MWLWICLVELYIPLKTRLLYMHKFQLLFQGKCYSMPYQFSLNNLKQKRLYFELQGITKASIFYQSKRISSIKLRLFKFCFPRILAQIQHHLGSLSYLQTIIRTTLIPFNCIFFLFKLEKMFDGNANELKCYEVMAKKYVIHLRILSF